MQLTFGNYELDPSMFVLRQDGAEAPVEPQVFDLLVYLAIHRDHTVSRQELMDELWAGRVVSESALSSCIKVARRAVGDSGHSQNIIATCNRRGYRFVADIQVRPDPSVPSAASDTPGGERLISGALLSGQDVGSVCLFPVEPAEHPDRPTLAVVPFSHSHGSQAVAWAADVLSEDISIQLARIPGFLVTSRNSAARYREHEVSIRQIGRELGTEYVSATICGYRCNCTRSPATACCGRTVWRFPPTDSVSSRTS